MLFILGWPSDSVVSDDLHNFISLGRTPKTDCQRSSLDSLCLWNPARSFKLAQPRRIAADFTRHFSKGQIVLVPLWLEICDVSGHCSTWLDVCVGNGRSASAFLRRPPHFHFFP